LRLGGTSDNPISFEICEEWDKICLLKTKGFEMGLEKRDWRYLLGSYLGSEGISGCDILSIENCHLDEIKLFVRFYAETVINPRIRIEP
jgi:hypothetical protein